MMHQITTGTPLLSYRGTDDQSANQIPREPLGQPQHLPKIFIWGQKGPITPQLCGGAERNLLYGEESFNPRSKFCTHSTIFANVINRTGNQIIYQRLVPEDATTANLTLWLDVVPVESIVYERLTDGSFKLDASEEKIPTGAVTPGFKVKWVSTFEPDRATLLDDYSARHQKAGSMVDAATGDPSIMYPIADFLYNGEGDKGNNAGIRLWTPTKRSDVYSKVFNEDLKVFPYFLSVMERKRKDFSYRAQPTVLGEKEVAFSFKEGLENNDTGQPLFIGDIFTDAYSTVKDPRYLPVHGDFSSTYIYSNSIEELVTMFHNAEIPFIDEHSDFTDDPEERHLFNFVSGVTLSNTPYTSFELVDEADSIRPTRYTTIPAQGGTDGDLSIDNFDQLCEVEFNRYSDPMDEAQDMAAFFEGDIYDSGFRMSTKFALIDAISLRPDLMIYLTPHVYKNPVLDRAEELGIMIALMSRIEAYPESVFFGTPTMRALILPGTGKVRNNLYREATPLLIELADKMAKMMGGSNGRWKESEGFDSMPGSAIDITTDINYKYMPVVSRQLYYDTGLNWVHRYKRDIFAFPVLKTVHRNPTSVLNSLMMAKAICWVNKVINTVWRHFCGNVKLTRPQLVARIDEAISKDANRQVFAGYCDVVPRTEITEMDKLRNFSITVPVEVYGNTPLTVMDTYIISKNMRDLNRTL